MFDLMAKVGITSSTKGQVLEVLEKINPLLASGKRTYFAVLNMSHALFGYCPFHGCGAPILKIYQVSA
jgi:hypothetical protein